MVKTEKKEVTRIVKAYFLYAIFACFFSNCSIFKSHKTVSGRIVDQETNLPLDQVNILLKNKDSSIYSNHYVNGCISESDGEFEMKYTGDKNIYILYISKIGYEELQISLKEAIKKDRFALKMDTQEHIDYIPNRYQ